MEYLRHNVQGPLKRLRQKQLLPQRCDSVALAPGLLPQHLPELRAAQAQWPRSHTAKTTITPRHRITKKLQQSPQSQLTYTGDASSFQCACKPSSSSGTCNSSSSSDRWFVQSAFIRPRVDDVAVHAAARPITNSCCLIAIASSTTGRVERFFRSYLAAGSLAITTINNRCWH